MHIQAANRLQANLASSHSKEALDALSRELKFKFDTKVKEERGAYVSQTPIKANSMGVFADALHKADYKVEINEATDSPGTLVLIAQLNYETPTGGRNGLSAGIYAYDTATRKLRYIRH